MSSASRRHTCVRSGVALGAAALLLAACSSSGKSGSTSGSTSGGGGASSTSGSTTSAASGSTTSTTSGSKLPKTLVFSPLALSPPALKGLAQGVTAYAKSKGWSVIVQDPNFDPNKQEQDLQAVLGSGRAGAAWVLANAPKSMGQTIKAAQAKGIPILVNGKPSEYGYSGAQPGVTFDYIDYAAGGRALGDQLGKCLVAKNGGKGDVIFAQSAPGQAGKAEFEAAAIAAVKSTAPGAHIVQSIVVKDRAGGQTDIGNALQGHPNVVGVMSSTDEGALGALGAFNAAGKSLKCVAEFGGDAEVLKDVQAGTIYGSVALQFNADLTQSFDTLAKMQADPKAKGLVLIVPQKIINKA